MVREIKTQPIRFDERSGLMHMLPKNLSQRGVEQMRRSMIALGIAATISRNGRPRFPKLHSAHGFSQRRDASVDLADFVDVDAPSLTLDLAAVRDLPARLRVEWRLAQDHCGAAVGQVLFGEDRGGDVKRVVAGERVDPIVSGGNLTSPLHWSRADCTFALARNPLPAGECIARRPDL